jgi:hypothetical protein
VEEEAVFIHHGEVRRADPARARALGRDLQHALNAGRKTLFHHRIDDAELRAQQRPADGAKFCIAIARAIFRRHGGHDAAELRRAIGKQDVDAVSLFEPSVHGRVEVRRPARMYLMEARSSTGTSASRTMPKQAEGISLVTGW